MVPVRHVVARVEATQVDPESDQMIPSTVPATPVSLAQVRREFLPVPVDVLDALEHDLASRVAVTVPDSSIPVPTTMPAQSPLPTWVDGSQAMRVREESVLDPGVPRSGRFAALSNTDDCDNECALVVRASSNADAGGRVAVPAGSASRPKRLHLVGHFQRISQATTVPAVPESSRDIEFDMTRGDSSSDTESVQHHVEEDREKMLQVSAVSEDVETGDNLEPDPEVREVIVTPTVRAALVWLDEVDLVEVFKLRASVMKSVPKFLAGAFRIALRTVLEEAVLGSDAGDEVRQIRGWKLLLLLPRLLLSKSPRGGTIGKDKLVKRFQMFANGQW